MLPSWDEMDFAANCTTWGNFVSSFVEPNPWADDNVLLGSYQTTIELFEASAPVGTFDTGEFGNLTALEQRAKIAEWYTWNVYGTLIPVDENLVQFNQSTPFWIHVGALPIEKCQDEYCSALGYTGNTDLTGVGVSRPSRPSPNTQTPKFSYPSLLF